MLGAGSSGASPGHPPKAADPLERQYEDLKYQNNQEALSPILRPPGAIVLQIIEALGAPDEMRLPSIDDLIPDLDELQQRTTVLRRFDDVLMAGVVATCNIIGEAHLARMEGDPKIDSIPVEVDGARGQAGGKLTYFYELKTLVHRTATDERCSVSTSQAKKLIRRVWAKVGSHGSPRDPPAARHGRMGRAHV